MNEREQPEALRLAEELRRLQQLNQKLLEVLDFYGRYILRSKSGDASILTPIDHDCGDRARAAIAKAEGADHANPQ